MKISMIAAVSLNGAIGKDGTIPWNFPEDMKFFREYTMNKTVIMGSKTADSLKGPLGGRFNIVITSKLLPYLHQGFGAFSTVEEAIQYASKLGDDIVFIGGARIYEEGMKYASEIVISRIPVHVDDADTYFPPIGLEWGLSQTTQNGNLKVNVYRKLECC